MSDQSRTPFSPLALLLSLVLIALLGAGAIALEKPVGQAEGQVVAMTGEKPLGGAKVTVSGPVTRSLLTGPDGRFHFFNLPAGTYYVSARSRRYDAQWQENSIEVAEGKTVKALDFKLARTQPSLSATNSQRVFTPKDPLRLFIRGTELPGLDATLYRFDLKRLLARDPDGRILRRHDPEELTRLGVVSVLKRWSQPLSARDLGEDAWFLKAVQLDPLAPGAYMLAVSGQPPQDEGDATMPARVSDAFWFDVSRLALVSKRAGPQLLAYAVDLVDKKPLAGVAVSPLVGNGLGRPVMTDAHGLARLDGLMGVERLYGEKNGSLALVAAGWDGDNTTHRVYAFTDRPVYRPGQTVHYKAIVRETLGARYATATGRTVHLEIKDANGALVTAMDDTVSAASSLDGNFVLPDNAPLGEYSAEFAIVKAGVFETIRFKVADYRKPEYKVDITTAKPRYAAGETAEVKLAAAYYFGAPVPGAKLQLTVYSAPLYGYRDPEADFYSGFTENNGVDPVWGYGDVVQQAEAVTDAEGNYSLSLPLAKAADAPSDNDFPQDHVYTVMVEAIDASGRPVKGTASFPVTQGDFRLRTQTDQYLYVGKRPINVTVDATSFEDKPVGCDVTVSLERLIYEIKTSQEGDEYTETKHQRVESKTQKTDAQGRARFSFQPKGEGDYIAHAVTHDAAGRPIADQAWAWVASEGEQWADAETMHYGSLQIVLDRKVYRPGDVAKALIVSPVAGVSALVTVEGTQLHSAQVVTLKGTSAVVSIPVTEAFKPNAFVAAAVVNGKEFLEASRSLNVLPEDKFLKVRLTTDKAKYEPGERATYTVETRDWKDHPVSAEVTLGVVDQAIYAIEPDATPDIRGFFHGPRWNTISTNYSFAADYSGGVDKFAPDPRVRAKFEDTAAWLPSLRTGANGKASVTVTLPDNLTTWVATAHAATTDTRVGAASQTIIATKDLLVRLETPRFVVMGDRLTVAGIIHNYTQSAQTVEATLVLEGLSTQAPATQQVVVAPGDAKRVTWQVAASRPGNSVKARIIVRGQTAADAMELPFPQAPFGVEGATIFAGEADGNKPGYADVTLPGGAIAGTASLTLLLHTSPLDAILGAVDYLHHYPYGCVEQTMSRFLPDAALLPRLRAIGAPVGDRFADQADKQREGLRRLAGMQHGDGGWGWWETDETQPEMTAYVMLGLAEARDGGLAIPVAVSKGGIGHLARTVPRIKEDLFSRSSVRRGGGADARAFALYALSLWSAAPQEEIDRLWTDRADLSAFGRAQLALTLAKVGDERRLAALAFLREGAVETATQLHWEANAAAYAWQDNSVEATAYALRALLAIAPVDPAATKVARWLESRNARGWWESTKDTGMAAIALADYMRAHPPGQRTQAAISVNGHDVPLASGTGPFEGQEPVRVPAAMLVPGPNHVEVTLGGDGHLDFTGSLAFVESAEGLPAASSHGLGVSRDYFAMSADLYARHVGRGTASDYSDAEVAELKALGTTVKSGERVLVRVTVTNDVTMRYLALEDPLPAGCEILEDQPANWGYWWTHQEYRDDRAAFFFDQTKAGTHALFYVMRPTVPGTFRVPPPTAWAMYTPDVRARGLPAELTITE